MKDIWYAILMLWLCFAIFISGYCSGRAEIRKPAVPCEPSVVVELQPAVDLDGKWKAVSTDAYCRRERDGVACMITEDLGRYKLPAQVLATREE